MGEVNPLYSKLPVLLQHLAVSSYGLYWYWLRRGRGYGRYIREYQEREYYTDDELKRWISRELKRILTLAAEHVPYYRETWTEAQKRSARAGILSELPILDKQPLRDNPKAFIRDDIKPLYTVTFHTSGSTGTPIATVWTVPEVRRSIALREARSARWAGVSYRLPRATFSGRLVVPDPESRGPYYRFNLVEKQVYFSAFHLRPETARDYVRALRRHRIVWLTGYAVSYYLLARFILEQNLDVPPLRAVITTSEKVTRRMKEIMERAYRCRVYEEYSTVENVLFASECEKGRLHVSPDAGIVEILREDGTPCEPGEVGEVVATCLNRDYQPFIRYRLGDMASWDPEPCPCGRKFPVLKEVVGRIEDVIIGPDGRRMVRFHGIFVDQPHVREGQVIQEDIDRLCIKIVPAEGFNERDKQDIIQRIQRRLGPRMRVSIELVDRVPRTKAGKFRAVVSKLKDRLPEVETTGVE